ncbi:phage protein NinX family protein [Variovorax sp. UC122_21]|uniref:phage protein NinX family protein n=1 Tax=Variovorax sp. UC122_21 TaxID=3374554 RepID=UPI00375717E1
MQIADLSAAALDYWVARAEGLSPVITYEDGKAECRVESSAYSPSSDWSQGGRLIERHRIMVAWNADHWIAGANAPLDDARDRIWLGRTALIAAMRAHVASVFGDEVSGQA